MICSALPFRQAARTWTSPPGASNTISVFAQGGVFMPGEFYEIEVLRGAGGDITALGSEDPRNFWVVTGGLNLRLR